MSKHWFDYLVLTFGAGVAVLCFLALEPGSAMHSWLSVLVGVFYAAWGIWHHKRSKDLSLTVALEYIVFGGFISLILFVGVSI